jgi:hypothetical protein
MSEVFLRLRGREITAKETAFLRELIAQNPGLSRRRLSTKVCEAWQWYQPNGQPRDMVCRSLMLALHRAGHIELPAKRHAPPNNAIAHRRTSTEETYEAAPLQGTISELGALEIQLVRRTEDESLFAHLLSRYHYLGYTRPVGEHLKYLIWAGGKPVACMAWCSAPLHLDLRDRFVGAHHKTYRHNLRLIAYNTRYLLLPWIQVRHLASHLLGRIARRISEDWQQVYHHPIHLLESFVDTGRFEGTCYQAANWTFLGPTKGFGKGNKRHEVRLSIKALWAYPLGPHFRQRLLAP